MMDASLTLPFIDVDRMNSPRPGDGKHTSARVRFAVALAILFAAWMVVRWFVI